MSSCNRHRFGGGRHWVRRVGSGRTANATQVNDEVLTLPRADIS